jgi:NADH-quinone oxidoreductase subunit F
VAEGAEPLVVRADSTLEADAATLATSRPGVFAGGDLVTGPNTVVDAIAAGKTGALMIDRWLRGEELAQPVRSRLPTTYVEPAPLSDDELEQASRPQPLTLPVVSRMQSFTEVERPLYVEDAVQEARRCLRCDLEFTQKQQDRPARLAGVGGGA